MTFTRLQKLSRGGVSPFHRGATLRDELDNLFQQALLQPLESTFNPGRAAQGSLPPLDLYEDKDGLVVKVELPGMKKEDIALTLEDGLLTVAAPARSRCVLRSNFIRPEPWLPIHKSPS